MPRKPRKTELVQFPLRRDFGMSVLGAPRHQANVLFKLPLCTIRKETVGDTSARIAVLGPEGYIYSDCLAITPALLPRHAALATAFQLVKLEKLMIEYTPAVGTAIGGRLVMGFDYDGKEEASTVDELMTNSAMTTSQPYQHIPMHFRRIDPQFYANVAATKVPPSFRNDDLIPSLCCLADGLPQAPVANDLVGTITAVVVVTYQGTK